MNKNFPEIDLTHILISGLKKQVISTKLTVNLILNSSKCPV